MWDELVRIIAHLCPSMPMVGYERGADLDQARSAGFADLGPLRVWGRPAPA